MDFDLNDRLAREKQPGRVRKLLEKPHNRYIRDKKQQYQEINEDIDDPDNCQDLIDSAECYLDCGDVYYEKPRVPVREAIQKFIGSH
ncbi:MAG: hypothetical protein AAGJ08_15935 [Cyanobacteria bacterium P01_H01_bin.35]